MKGNIDTDFEWEKCEEDNYSIEFEPAKGIVKAKSDLNISIRLKANGG